jgi:hypothetical protein
MKRSDLPRLVIQGELDEVITKMDYIISNSEKFSNSATHLQTPDDVLKITPKSGYSRLCFYALKHKRFDILDHFNYTDFRDDEISSMGRHLGGKYKRYKSWFEAFEKSELKKNIGKGFEDQIIKSLVVRSEGLYDMEMVFNIISEHPHTRDEYFRYYRGRTTKKGIQMFTKMDRDNKLNKLLDD